MLKSLVSLTTVCALALTAPLVLRCEEFEWVSFICQTALVIPM